MIVEVLKSGMFTTIQDHGRVGYAHLGVAVGGAIDIGSMELANLLVSKRLWRRSTLVISGIS